jgi:multidrug/hemolysin transport system permease protein
MFVIIMLYAFFLMDIMVQSAGTMNPDGNARAFVSAWLVGSLIVINAINSTLEACGIMAEDEEFKKVRDFIISPQPEYKRTFSYIIAAVISGLIISAATLVLGYFVVLIVGKTALGFTLILKLIPGILFTVAAVAAVTVFGYSFIKKTSVVSAVSILAVTLVGFLIGAYMPIGQMAKPVQIIMKCIPFTYAASLFRSILLSDISAAFFDGVPVEVAADTNGFMGNSVTWGAYEVPNWLCLVIMISTAVIFFALTVLRLKLQKRKS